MLELEIMMTYTQEDLEEARALILPIQGRKEYCIITGQRGLGKSVLVRKIAYKKSGVLLKVTFFLTFFFLAFPPFPLF